MTLLIHASACAVFGETKEGTCCLQQADPFDRDVFTVHVGEKIQGTCKFFVQEFFGRKIINANIEIANTSGKTMYCQYYVAFLNRDGQLIGCAGQGTFGPKGLPAEESTQLGGCLIPLPAGLVGKAVRYQIAFYESDKEIGTDQGRAAGRRTQELRPEASGSAAPGDAGPQETTWYFLGPGFKELARLAETRGVSVSGRNHDTTGYAYILSSSQPGSTILLLFALNKHDKNVPAEYADLLPMPWPQIEAALKKGETVERTGEARGRKIVLLAAPTERQLYKLIDQTHLLPRK
jgi:hypothetical protein